jgi:hypothetical protein
MIDPPPVPIHGDNRAVAIPVPTATSDHVRRIARRVAESMLVSMHKAMLTSLAGRNINDKAD